MQMVLAISAASAPGLIEQRIMVGLSGLEHVMWQNLVLTKVRTESNYRNERAANLLRDVLGAASIPAGLDTNLQPVMASLAAAKTTGGPHFDGAEVLTWTRNQLVHPKPGRQRAYQYPGLLLEAWQLLRHYLVLLVLHSLGYQGSYRDPRALQGMASATMPVPWKVSASQVP